MAEKLTDAGLTEIPQELPPPIGDNSRAASLPELLAEKYPDLAVDAKRLLDKADVEFVDPIQNEAAQKKAGDYFVELVAFLEKMTAQFRNEKAPWLTGSRAVDNFFKIVGEPLRTKADEIERATANYLEWKKNETDKKLRAEKAKAEEDARIARAKAEQLAREARVAADDAAKKIAASKSVSVRTAKTMLPAAVVRKQDRATDAALTAQQAERRVDHVEQKIDDKAANKVRTRGGSSVSTLAEEWTFTIEDLSKIPVEIIRPYFHPDAFETAVKGFVKAGHRKLAGVRIYKAPKANIRR